MRFFNQRNYNLLRELVISDFKVRYQGSALGYLWSLLKPLALFTVLYIVFAHFFRLGEDVPYFAPYLLLGVVFWTFFAECTNRGLRAIVDNGDMIRKVSVPKYSIVISGTVSALINLILNLGVFSVFLIVSGAPLMWTLLLLPLAVLQLYALSLAVSFLLAALYVKFRDMEYIWEVVSQVLFYATPIIYPLSIVPDVFVPLVMINPLAQVVQDARYWSITTETTTTWAALPLHYAITPVLLTISLVLGASWYFKRRSKYFAEEL